MDCVEKFKAMQDCFRENPDVYGEGTHSSHLLACSAHDDRSFFVFVFVQTEILGDDEEEDGEPPAPPPPSSPTPSSGDAAPSSPAASHSEIPSKQVASQ